MIASCNDAEAQTVEEMRENGTLLIAFVFAVFAGFYVFCIVLVFLAGGTEKKLSKGNQKNKSVSNTQSNTLRSPTPYSIPEAQSFLSNQQPKKNKAYT